MDEERKISFYSDAAHNFMVLECPPELKENYQYKMLAANRIKGLLTCSGRTIDNREYLYYDISSRQNLTDLYDRRPVSSADLNRILSDLVCVQKTLTEYLLDTSHLILSPACIYMDFREQACCFAYYPGQEPEKGMEDLFSFLADRVDGRDKQAAALIYRLCMMAEKPGFRLDTRVLEDLGMQIDQDNAGALESYGQKSSSIYENGIGIYGQAERGRTSLFPGYGTLYAGETSGRNPSGERNSGVPGGSGISGNPGIYSNPVKTDRAVRDRKIYPDYETEAYTAYDEREKGGVDSTNVDRCAKTFAEKGPWMLAAAIILAALGIMLFIADRFLEMEESQMLLTRAFGGILTVTGLVILLLLLLRKRKKRNEENPGNDAAPGFKEPEPWESPAFYNSSPLYQETAWAGTFSSAPVVQAPAQMKSFSPSVPPGETCLLGPDVRQAAGLYGTGIYRGEQISLSELPCVIGKNQAYVDQVLDDSSVSRMHARFSLDRDGKMTVRDLNSSNGTWVNGDRLIPNESRTLQQGDHVCFGRMEFVFR